jgi:hypothetical protein
VSPALNHPDLLTKRRWATPILIFLIAVILGAVTGALSNWFNVEISDRYFLAIMNWPADDVQWLAVHQGIFEGSCLGAFFGLVFSIASGATSQLRLPLGAALRVVGRALLIVLCCWTIGGLLGVGLDANFPHFFEDTFVGVPSWSPNEALFYAWVGGTIWGAYAGTAIATLTGCVILHRRWRSAAASALIATAFPVIPIVAQSGEMLQSEATSSPDRDLVV